MNAIQVVTTTSSRASAQSLATALVERRLAACAQIEGPITSVYRWQGKVETAEEWRVTAKTLAEVYPRLERAVRELHAYEEPEILALPITAGSESYLRWLAQEVMETGGSANAAGNS